MHVTICIGTRDRGDCILRTLHSIANSHYGDFDVVVVDQSVSDDTGHAMQRVMLNDSRFAYIRTRSVGASAARNCAVSHAKGPIVAFTDDDCEVSPEWVGFLVRYFCDHPEVGQVCGAVRAGAHEQHLGFIPTYPVSHVKRISSPWLKWREGGIGANMAFRLDTLRAVGPFDEVLGAGGQLYSCEDGDMTYRVLRAGYTVLSVLDGYVIHHGFRTWAEGQTLVRQTGAGVGAAYMKHLRLGDAAILPTLVYEGIRTISWRHLLLLRKRNGVARFLGYLRGMALSFKYPIDTRQRVYLLTEDSRS